MWMQHHGPGMTAARQERLLAKPLGDVLLHVPETSEVSADAASAAIVVAGKEDRRT